MKIAVPEVVRARLGARDNSGARRSWWGIGALAAIAIFAAYLLLRPAPEPTSVVVTAGEFVQQVSLSGKVVAARDVDLGFAGSGRVTRVYADVGDTVAAGQVLAEIENGDLRAALSQREAALASQQAKLAALEVGPRPESIAVAEAALASAESAHAQARLSLVNALQSAYAVADDAVRNKTDQIINNPRSAWPTLGFTSSDSQTGTTLLNERVVLETQLRAWEASVVALSAESDLMAAGKEAHAALDATSQLLSDANITLNAAIPTTGVPLSTITGWITTVAVGRSAVTGAITALTVAETAQRSSATALVSAQKALALAKAGTTAEDLAGQRAMVRAAQADVDSARAQLAKTLITAPFAGIVTKMDAKQGMLAGGSIPVASLASRGTFQIEGYVPEINVALVKQGAPATVTLDAYGTGVIFNASVVSLDPAETVRDGVSTYRVLLQFAEADERIRSGMTANMTILAGKRDNILSVPVGVVVQEGSGSYVMVLTDKGQEKRTVETGPVSSKGEIEIISGLTEGERVLVPAQ